MRHIAARFVVAGVGMFVAGCGGSNQAHQTSTTTLTSLIPRPVVERELEPLLLTPAQVNPLMGATGMAVIRKHDAMSDDSATMRPAECLAIDGSAQARVYANSGFTGVRDQELNDGDNFNHYAEQAVVLFPTVKQAHVFFVTSALRASNAEITNSTAVVQSLDRLGMPLYGMQTPNGYAWSAEPWVSTSALVTRMNFALVLAGNRLSGTRVAWPASTPSVTPVNLPASPATAQEALERQLEYAILGEPAGDRTRRTIVAPSEHEGLREQAERDFLPSTARAAEAGHPPAAASEDEQTAIIAGLLLGSPEFQRR